MYRRLALTGALFLTALFGFVVVGYGEESGLLGSDGGSETASASGGETPAATAAPTDPTPKIIDEFIVVDDTSSPSDNSGPSPSSGPSSEGDTDDRSGPNPGPEHEGDDDIDDHDEDDDDFDDEDDDDFDDDEVDEIEFHGEIISADSSSITVAGPDGSVTLIIDSTTSVRGSLTPGLSVEVEAFLASDGSWIAKEIESEDH